MEPSEADVLAQIALVVPEMGAWTASAGDGWMAIGSTMAGLPVTVVVPEMGAWTAVTVVVREEDAALAPSEAEVLAAAR